MHAEVVIALDQHLAEMHRLRRQLTDPRTIEPGERLSLALTIAASARRLAQTVHDCHRAPAEPPDAMTPSRVG